MHWKHGLLAVQHTHRNALFTFLNLWICSLLTFAKLLASAKAEGCTCDFMNTCNSQIISFFACKNYQRLQISNQLPKASKKTINDWFVKATNHMICFRLAASCIEGLNQPTRSVDARRNIDQQKSRSLEAGATFLRDSRPRTKSMKEVFAIIHYIFGIFLWFFGIFLLHWTVFWCFERCSQSDCILHVITRYLPRPFFWYVGCFYNRMDLRD